MNAKELVAYINKQFTNLNKKKLERSLSKVNNLLKLKPGNLLKLTKSPPRPRR